jgi:hypothetical protein
MLDGRNEQRNEGRTKHEKCEASKTMGGMIERKNGRTDGRKKSRTDSSECRTNERYIRRKQGTASSTHKKDCHE